MRTLLYDLEVAPGLAWGYGLGGFKPVYVGLENIVERERVWTFSYRWDGESKTHFMAEWQFPGTQAEQHLALIKRLIALVDEADVLIAFNGKNFDDQWVRREALELGLLPPSPWISVDLYQETRRFRFMSHKLQHIVTVLLDDTKVATAGMIQMYMRYLAGDLKVRREIRLYNNQDVDLMVELLEILRPWIKLPSAPLADGTQIYDPEGEEMPQCPRLGCHNPTHVQRRGERTLATGVYQQWQCQSCGGWFKTNRRDRGTRFLGVQG